MNEDSMMMDDDGLPPLLPSSVMFVGGGNNGRRLKEEEEEKKEDRVGGFDDETMPTKKGSADGNGDGDDTVEVALVRTTAHSGPSTPPSASTSSSSSTTTPSLAAWRKLTGSGATGSGSGEGRRSPSTNKNSKNKMVSSPLPSPPSRDDQDDGDNVHRLRKTPASTAMTTKRRSKSSSPKTIPITVMVMGSPSSSSSSKQQPQEQQRASHPRHFHVQTQKYGNDQEKDQVPNVQQGGSTPRRRSATKNDDNDDHQHDDDKMEHGGGGGGVTMASDRRKHRASSSTTPTTSSSRRYRSESNASSPRITMTGLEKESVAVTLTIPQKDTSCSSNTGDDDDHNDDDVPFDEEMNKTTNSESRDSSKGFRQKDKENGDYVGSGCCGWSRRRSLIVCFLISVLTIGAAAGVIVYFFLRDGGFAGINSSAGSAAQIQTTQAPEPTASPTMTAQPTASPAPSVTRGPTGAPTTSPSAFPSDAPSSSPTTTPSASPTTTPTISLAPSASPTSSPTQDFRQQLEDFLYAEYSVPFTNGPNTQAAIWMAQEAQQSLAEGTGTLTLDDSTVQRFAILSLDFGLQQGSGVDQGVVATARNQLTPKESLIGQPGVDECEWDGIVCNDDGQVTRIELAYRDLTGILVPAIGLLKTLKWLDVSNNYLTKRIPEDLYTLTDLERLYLFKNSFTGTISTRIGDLDKLTHFHLSHNALSGSIPVELKSDAGSEEGIRPVQYFNVYSNRLTGTIPEGLRLRRMHYFDVGRNQMTGRLPVDFGEQSVELRMLHLDNNGFQGTLPRSYNSVGNDRLEALSIDHNRLTGWVPGERKLYNKLVQYTLHVNRFQGIDPENCRLELGSGGELVEFKADCGICRCNGFLDLCDRQCSR